jgi:fructose 1,6-bisphosphatase
MMIEEISDISAEALQRFRRNIADFLDHHGPFMPIALKREKLF